MTVVEKAKSWDDPLLESEDFATFGSQQISFIITGASGFTANASKESIRLDLNLVASGNSTVCSSTVNITSIDR